MKEPCWLLDFASKTFSQNGEDGVLWKCLELLPARDRWCVEFGAWDGKYLSNVRRLIEQADYSAVMIEADKSKFRELVTNYSDNKKVKPLNAYVGFSGENRLDALLEPIGVPKDFDVLSIDIDGNDYHVWQALQRYRPKLVCIEFNPTIPTEVAFVQPADACVNQGCSVLSLFQLAKEKGYELIAVLPLNAIFVDARYFSRFEIADNRPATLRQDASAITWMFFGYDGSVHIAGAKKLPWHNMPIDERRLQMVPRFLRRYPKNYSRLQKLLYKAYKRCRTWCG
jgi:hypothetical protein